MKKRKFRIRPAIIVVPILLAALWVGISMRTKSINLMEGARAPAFALSDASGRIHRLADYHGGWLVVYFYPKDDTPGCTEQACRFRDDYQAIRELGVTVVGVSLDGAKNHARFAEKYSLPFTLLSDPGGATAKTYGALWSFGPLKFAKRYTFIIDPYSHVAKIYRKVSTAAHSTELISDIRALKRDAK